MTSIPPWTGDIYTDEICQPGYVFWRCARYNLPDNTQRGYHQTYLPLWGAQVHGNTHVTPAMCDDLRTYYAAQEASADAKREAEHKAAMARIEHEHANYNSLESVRARHFAAWMKSGEGEL